jgi:sugar O-acyltransferase (sialic acid O-acetyltransferase NeuD family)
LLNDFIMKKICIFGSGGSARETYWIAKRCGYEVEALLDYDPKGSYHDIPILSENYFDKKKHFAVVAIGNSGIRKKVTEKIISRHGNVFISLIDPCTVLLSPHINIGIGAVVAPRCVLTCNIIIGAFCQLNVATNIMHDANIGDFFTTATGVNINGCVKIGNVVYFGSNASTKEEICITNHVTIGVGACVVKNITESGVYIGVPAHKLKRKQPNV